MAFGTDGDRVIIRKVARERRGGRLAEAMRRGGTVRMSTEEIMALTRGEP
jgi:hypothetical protein